MNVLFATIFAYLIGSIPFALTIGKVFLKKDIRTIGSGNQGATNMYRAGGLIPAVILFFLDFSKGIVALYVFFQLDIPKDIFVVFTSIAVILGHIFPIFGNFKGGKGVSTSAGVLFFINPIIFVCSFTIFWIVFFSIKIVSVASISAVISMLLISISMYYFDKSTFALPLIAFSITAILLLSHRENFKRLKNGTENKP